MKNLKKFLAVVITVAMVATLMVPALAEGEISADAQACADIGMLQGSGDGVTVEYTASTPTRLTAAILLLRLKGLEAEALAFAGEDNFADADEVLWSGGQKIMAYLKANPEVGFEGIGDDLFDPNTPMSAKAYTKVLLVALGYEYGVDFTWDTVVSFAASVGLISLLDATDFTVDALAVATVEALQTNTAGTETTLIASLVDAGKVDGPTAGAAGIYTYVAPVPDPLAVASVTATNYKEVVVTFNQAADSALLGDVANYTVAGGVASVTVASDNKSVTLLLTGNITAGGSIDVIVLAAIMGTDTTVTASGITDGTLPEIVSAEAVGNSSIKVTMSEPVQTIGNPADYKLDGLFFSQSALPAVAGRVITITPSTRLTAGEHTLTVSSTITDFATYGMTTSRDVTFSVATDVDAPTVSFDSATQKQVVVKFNEAVVKATIEGAAITFTNGVTKNVATLGTDGMTLTVTVNGTIPASGLTTMTIPVAGVVDTFGNSPSADLTVAFTGNPDTARPEVVEVAFATDDQTKLYVTYNKEVALDGDYTLTKTASDGTVTTILNAAITDAHFVDAAAVTIKSKVVLTIGGAAYDSTATYSLLIKDTTDTPNPLANKVVDYVANGLVVADLTASLYQNIKVVGQSMYITFDTAIGASTAIASNFVYVRGEDSKVVNGLPSGATIVLINSDKTIKITWETVAANATDGLNPAILVQIQWTGIFGTDGNAVTSAVKTKAGEGGGVWAGAGAAPLMGAVEVTGANTITLAVTNPTDFIFDAAKALADFNLEMTTAGTVLNLVNVSYDSTTSKITFTTYETIGPDGKYATETVTLYTDATTTLVDLFGQSFVANAAGAVAADKIVPTVASTVATIAAPGVITITFDEALQNIAAPLVLVNAELAVIVDGVNVTNDINTAATAVVGNTLTITLTAKALVADDVVEVLFTPAAGSSFKDVANNVLGAFSVTDIVN